MKTKNLKSNIKFFLVASLLVGGCSLLQAGTTPQTKVEIIDPTLSIEENQMVIVLKDMIIQGQNKSNKKSWAHYAEELISILKKDSALIKRKPEYKKIIIALEKTKSSTKLMQIRKSLEPLYDLVIHNLPGKVQNHFKVFLGERKLLNRDGSLDKSKLVVIANKIVKNKA